MGPVLSSPSPVSPLVDLLPLYPWTRNSVTVTEGTETVLDDPVTEQYTHTLTLSTAGVYTCNVANNKPSNDSASYTVQGTQAPTNVMAVQMGLTRIRVSWTPSSDATGYIISYTGGSSSESVTVSGGSTYNYLLTDLQNGDIYTISIVAKSDGLNSESVIVMNVQLVPGQPTVNIDSTSFTSISLSWSVPSSSVVTSYEVTWQRDSSLACSADDEGSAAITDGSTSYDIVGLEEGQTYTITVTATNTAGMSPASNTVSTTLIAQPESVIIHPVNATAVRVSWSNNPHHNTSLHYTSHFTATGAMISHHETVLSADVDSTDVAIDLDRDGYEHNFTLQYIKTCHVTPSPVIEETFAFDKKYFQIQFGPIDYCLNWGLEKTGRIEDQLQSQLTLIIRERCTDCYTFSTAFFRQGQFLCHDNPTTATYRSTLVYPFPTTNSTQLVGIIQSWVSMCPSLILDGLVVRVYHDVPTCIPSLHDGECVDDVESVAGVAEVVSQVLSVCAVRALGQEICTI